LKPEDAVLAVNGSSTDTMNVDDVVNIIRGAVGTTVKLSILRAGWAKPQDFTMTRENIQVPTVDFEMRATCAHYPYGIHAGRRWPVLSVAPKSG